MIALRSLHPKDDLFIFKLMSDPLVTQNLPDADSVNSFDEAKRVLQEMIRDTQQERRFCQAIVHKDYDVLMGLLVANNKDLDEKSMYVAYELFPAHWGKGIAEDALRRFISLIEKLFSLKKIYAQTTVNNHRSQAILKKIGFTKEKEFVYSKPVNGRFVKAFLYSLNLRLLKEEKEEKEEHN